MKAQDLTYMLFSIRMKFQLNMPLNFTNSLQNSL